MRARGSRRAPSQVHRTFITITCSGCELSRAGCLPLWRCTAAILPRAWRVVLSCYYSLGTCKPIYCGKNFIAPRRGGAAVEEQGVCDRWNGGQALEDPDTNSECAETPSDTPPYGDVHNHPWSCGTPAPSVRASSAVCCARWRCRRLAHGECTGGTPWNGEHGPGLSRLSWQRCGPGCCARRAR